MGPRLQEMGKDRDWLDRLWTGTEADVTPGPAAGASMLAAGGPAPNEAAPEQEEAGSDTESISLLVDQQPLSESSSDKWCPNPVKGAYGLDTERPYVWDTWKMGAMDQVANLELDWTRVGKAYQMRKKQQRKDHLFVFDDGPGSDYGGCDDCLDESLMAMKR
eukprot:3932908-Rhodomonas_salina.1